MNLKDNVVVKDNVRTEEASWCIQLLDLDKDILKMVLDLAVLCTDTQIYVQDIQIQGIFFHWVANLGNRTGVGNWLASKEGNGDTQDLGNASYKTVKIFTA